ncbi:bifunctional DNA primase/polymerase [Rhodosalinus sp. FB01]|uniref:bifunctional DNA primase/polymerase n=1 Tax=Rhodosalinus sp. FB01 TaxID=3239194 RepID=UPI00352536BA
MSDRPTAYQLAADLWDRFGIPSFPVLLAQDETGKWQKKPLVKWGAVTPDTQPGEFNWGGTNAVGVPMGRRSNLFAFDVDSYKPGCAYDEWASGHELPPTRTHGTTSGGRHLIYQMPPCLSLGNSAPKVQGLDVRGDGGFIVWTDTLGRYSVIDDRAPAALPRPVINLLIELNAGKGRILRDTEVPDPKYVGDTDLLPKLRSLLGDPLRNCDLVNRFRGGTSGLKDKSRSSMDMSVAGLLSRAGFSYDEIVTTLLRHFQHGKAGRDGWTDAVEREVCRCAHKAVTQRDEKLVLIRQQLETSVSDLRERLSLPQNAEDRA